MATRMVSAQTLGVNQEQASRTKSRGDLRLSALRRSIEAMGGELIVLARFPDAEPVKITEVAS